MTQKTTEKSEKRNKQKKKPEKTKYLNRKQYNGRPKQMISINTLNTNTPMKSQKLLKAKPNYTVPTKDILKGLR